MIFLHGLESSPEGSKSVYLRQRHGARVPALDNRAAIASLNRALAQGRRWEHGAPDLTQAMALPLEQARAALEPDTRLVVGSSFGGALLLQLMHEGAWTGPALFLAGAGVKLTPHRRLPEGARAVLIHGRQDDVVPLADARTLAATGGAQVQLWEVGDGHRLQSILTDGTLDAAIRWLLDVSGP
jgi:pimeloyl-ACP methyl ester carboxylesterase